MRAESRDLSQSVLEMMKYKISWSPSASILLFVFLLTLSLDVVKLDRPITPEESIRYEPITDGETENIIPISQSLSEQAENDKRTSSFFGLRGKKNYYDGKRTSPFFGLRGKREDFDSERTSPFFSLRGKRDDFEGKMVSPFFGLRGRREDFDYKRGSPFFGLRGKKFMEDDTMEKRVFHALRGKKDDSKVDSYINGFRNAYEDLSSESQLPFSDESKRAESFYGLRGKRFVKEMASTVH
ncbi:uncharacterized protein LOC143248381 [Tachypleus tridentatus]|uniref:uncharacterized protein LOC143248381 n=1 Tax=Tachypleus tridentatus TaxID=6853 RepID=UPI003FD1F09C